ncbi:hypothetical protein CAY59_16010 [Vibrio campbellii]|uniref:glycosyltransferase family 4 protein n=1 Tax=Vibrio campbellii TaxID=680 RepID=UPI000A2F8C93|nr:glycosyltransferase family 4 protein [Vibrio campbellii]ARR45725.1 hypothetical protein CAY59_16010 [Vibrio campbellii]
MKILLVNSFYSPYGKGGAERSLKVIADSLSREGHSVTVICCSQKSHVDIVDGVSVHYMKLNPFLGKGSFLSKIAFHFLDFFNFYSLYKVFKLSKEIRPDIINFNNLYGFSPSVLLVGRILKIKTILTLRDYYGLCVKSSLYHKGCQNEQGSLCKKISILKKILFNACVDYVVANSKKTLSIFKQSGYFLDGIESKHIYNGFDLSRSIREKDFSWNSENEKINIGYFGKICPDKGFEVFYEAAKKIDANFYVAGEWAIDSISPNDMPDNFKYLGFVSPQEMFNKIDVLVVPSLWHDPLPRTVFEAMSFGIPVVGSDRGGIPEAIANNSGWVYEAENFEQLRNILVSIVKKEYDLPEYSRAAKNNAQEFSQDLTVENYFNLYMEVTQK